MLEVKSLARFNTKQVDLSLLYAESCNIPPVADTGLLPVAVVQSIAIHVSAQ
jgi:hypothetical protein